MKKLFLILACTSFSVGCFAEELPATSLYESGKAKFSKFDDAQVKMQMKQAVDSAEMGANLLGGYEDFMKALPLDTIVQKEKDGTPKIDKKTGKAKVKTKYSKDIVGLVAGHHNDFAVVGQIYNEKKDYLNAAKAWEIYATLPEAKFLRDTKIALADSTAGMFLYYAGVMYYQEKKHEAAVNAFQKALKKGYDKKEVFDMIKYEYSVLIGELLEKKDYDKCESIIDKAIAENPNEAMYVMFKGIFIESKTDDIEKALPFYVKATEMDATLGMAFYHVGRYYNNKAVNLMNAKENSSLTDAELGKIIDPLCEKAKPYLQKAVELDVEGTNTEAKRLLRWVEDRLAK